MIARKLILDNDVSELEKMNSFLEALSDEWALSPKLQFNLNLVLEELITNVIFYAYEDEEKHQISISFSRENEQVAIEILDDGKAFNPLEKDVPDDLDKDIDERKIGGLGIHFVKSLMDEVAYERTDKGMNRLVLSTKSK
jgi:anti-sigma regulatory factor (Ser/Thr protein kinase)